MNKIDKIADYCVNGKFDIQASFKEDDTSTESKTVTLRFLINDVPLSNILNDALKSRRIAWANNARKNYGKIADKSVVEIVYGARLAPVVDLKANATNYLQTCSDEEFLAITGVPRPRK